MTNTPHWIVPTVVVFSDAGALITVLVEDMFNLYSRVKHQYKLYNLTDQDKQNIRYGVR